MTVLVRDPAKLPADHNASRVLVGDVLNKEDVKRTMEGQDAVIIILGTRNDLSKWSHSQSGDTHKYRPSFLCDLSSIFLHYMNQLYILQLKYHFKVKHSTEAHC